MTRSSGTMPRCVDATPSVREARHTFHDSSHAMLCTYRTSPVALATLTAGEPPLLGDCDTRAHVT
jgi:hypothetical protein